MTQSSELEGPFVIPIISGGEGKPTHINRWIVGGPPPNAKERAIEAVRAINELPEGLEPIDLNVRVGEIISRRNLLRVDF